MSWDKYIEESIGAVRKGDYLATEDSLKLALQYAKQNYPRGDGRLAFVLSLLGHTYFVNTDFGRATLLLEQSLKLHIESRLPDNPCLIMDLFCLGEIKKSRGKRVDACRLFTDVLDQLKETRTKSGDMVRAIDRFHDMLVEQRSQLSEVERRALDQPLLAAMQTAIETALSITGGAIELEPIGSSEETNGSADGVDSEHHSAAREAEAAPMAPAVAPSPAALAEVWQMQLKNGLNSMQAEDDERETLVSGYLNLESALRLARGIFERSDERFIGTVKAIADASAKLRMFNQAEALYREAVAMAKSNSTGAEPTVSTLRLNLALLYCDFDLFKASKGILDEEGAVNESVQDYEELNKRVAHARDQIRIFESATELINQAQIAEKDGDYEKAAKLTNNAMSQMKQGFAPNHGELAGMLRYRARVLKLLQRDDQATELMERAERIERAQDTMATDWLKITDDLPRAEVAGVAV